MTANTNTVASEILRQIQALDRWFLGAVAAKDFVGTETGLRFKIGRNPKMSHVKVLIDLDHATDTYTVTFGKVRKHEWKVLKEITGVYAETLTDILNSEIG